MDHANMISRRVSGGQKYSNVWPNGWSHAVNKFTPEAHTKSIVLVMNTQQILVIAVIVAALISVVLVSFFVTTTNTLLLLPPNIKTNATTTVFQESNKNNKIQDSRGDAKLIPLYKTDIFPKVRDYHDILSAEVNKINDDKNLLLTLDLAGDANKNEKCETVYLWLIKYSNSFKGIDQQKFYTVIIPNFALNSNFKNKHGWYLAIFNNTNNSYTLPLSKISDMPKNKVQVFIDPDFIGNPQSFNYIVSVMIRVNSTFLDKPPDYLVDFAPDNEVFWIRQWFS